MLTVRTYCYKNGQAPFWWNPCFDLSTEFHIFLKEVISRQIRRAAGEPLHNNWILKPAHGTRAFGHQIVNAGQYASLPLLPGSDNSAASAASSVSVESVFSKINSATSAESIIAALDLLLAGEEGVMDSQLRCILRDICECYRPLAVAGDKQTPSADVVAQLLIQHPLTVKRKKFDFRVFALVRSFEPFEGM